MTTSETLPSSPSKTAPFFATLKERTLLSKEGSTKETYHLVLDCSNSSIFFQPGDSLAVFPQNDPQQVNALLSLFNTTGEEEYNGSTLRHFLTNKADLNRVHKSWIATLFSATQSPFLGSLLQEEQAEKLRPFLLSHTAHSFLKEFSGNALTLPQLCALFSPLLPRFYSIASSPKIHPNEIHLTVTVAYFEQQNEKRCGVATHFLCHLAQLQQTPIPIYVQPTRHFRLPDDTQQAIIMVGPGTGVAPFRSFLQERTAQPNGGKNWLIFGERHREFDFYYEEFWNALIAQGSLELDVAFSRDQAEKVYVYHKLEEKGSAVWHWLQKGAHFYICGDAKRMAKEVEKSLLRIVQKEGNLSEEQAKSYLQSLRKERRYLLDVY